MRIRIISIPSGEAPEWVRKAWIGLELEIAESSKDVKVFHEGALGGKVQNLGGYSVDFSRAMTILSDKNKRAAEWWLGINEKRPVNKRFMWLTFAKEVCEVLD